MHKQILNELYIYESYISMHLTPNRTLNTFYVHLHVEYTNILLLSPESFLLKSPPWHAYSLIRTTRNQKSSPSCCTSF
jgi:hypothetical protein